MDGNNGQDILLQILAGKYIVLSSMRGLAQLPISTPFPSLGIARPRMNFRIKMPT